MLLDILAIQISTVASESAFSTSGRVLDPYRTSLSTSIVEALICTQDWVRKSRKPIVDDVDDILKDDDIAIGKYLSSFNIFLTDYILHTNFVCFGFYL